MKGDYTLKKAIIKSCFLAIVIVLLTFSLVSCSNQNGDSNDSTSVPTAPTSLPETTPSTDLDDTIIQEVDPLDAAIKAAIIEQNQGNYLPGESYGVGYKVMETFEEDDTLSIYAIVEYVEYRFEDGVFVNISGTNPQVLMRFRQSEEKQYDLIFYTRLDIFSDLSEETLKELMQPLIDTGKDYAYTDQDLVAIRAQADEYASKYLQSIGRDAEIGIRQEHDGQTLEELVSNEALLKELFKDVEISLYPTWTGTTERIENGTRYIYQTVFDSEQQEIVYIKSAYDTNDVIKRIVVDVQNETIIR